MLRSYPKFKAWCEFHRFSQAHLADMEIELAARKDDERNASTNRAAGWARHQSADEGLAGRGDRGWANTTRETPRKTKREQARERVY